MKISKIITMSIREEEGSGVSYTLIQNKNDLLTNTQCTVYETIMISTYKNQRYLWRFTP